MAKYMIHAYPKRMWYVEEYLVPSMIEQGIDKDDITVWNDGNGDGNLQSCMKAFESLGNEGGTWHLQDDVVISKHFKEYTEKNDSGIVCAFCNEVFDKENVNLIGIVPVRWAWFSFPCIRIPNKYAKECAEWYFEKVVPNNLHEDLASEGKNDDAMWKVFIIEEHPEEMCYNFIPNLVDHIDYLIGGSASNPQRDGVRRGYRFSENDVVEELEKKLKERNSADTEPRQKRSRKRR